MNFDRRVMPVGMYQPAPVGTLGTASMVMSTRVGVSYTSAVCFSISAKGNSCPAGMVSGWASCSATGAGVPADRTPPASEALSPITMLPGEEIANVPPPVTP